MNIKYCPFHAYDSDMVSKYYYCDGDSCELWLETNSYTFKLDENGNMEEVNEKSGGCAFRMIALGLNKTLNWGGVK